MGGYTAGCQSGRWVRRCVATFAVLMAMLGSGNLLANSNVLPSTGTVVHSSVPVGQIIAVSDDPGTVVSDKPATSQPLLGLAKSADGTRWLGDNRFRTTISLYANNSGDRKAKDLNILDDLVATFGSSNPFTVLSGSLSSDTFQVNPHFNGRGDTAVLAPGNFLAAGAQGSVEFVVEFAVDDGSGAFTNTAEIVASNAVADWSTEGQVPDPNGDGLPSERTPATIAYIIPQALLGIAKSLTRLDQVDENTFLSEFELTVENFGQAPASNVDVQDNLGDTFAGVVSFKVVSGSLSSNTFLVNERFDGVKAQNLLLGGNSLAAGETASIVFSVEFEIDEETPALANSASASSEGGSKDASTPGRDPDPNGDNTPDESGATKIPAEFTPPLVERVGLAKAVDQIEVDEGRVNVRFLLVVDNLGSAELQDLQVFDDLNQTFGEGVVFEVVPGSLQSADLLVNKNFDGDNETNLLRSGSILPAGQSASISFEVQFIPLQESGTFFNSANAVTSSGLVDQSTSGINPDPNNDGIPDEAEPTAIDYVLPPAGTGVPGLAKAASPARLQADTFVSTLTFVVENLGNKVLVDLQITDNLRDVFPADVEFAVVEGSLSSDLLAVNQNFDGDNNVNLLLGSEVLAAGAAARVQFDVAINPNGTPGPFQNVAFATAAGGLRDSSTNGSDPDPDGNGVPDEAQVTLIKLDIEPSIELHKTVTAIEPTLQGNLVSFEVSIANSGNVPLSDVQLIDDLQAAFADVSRVEVVTPVEVSGGLNKGNSNFSPSEPALLSGNEVLAVGAEARLTFQVLLDNFTGTQLPRNTVVADARTPDGQRIEQSTSVPVDLPSGITGVVFIDENHNGVLDDFEMPATAFLVELFDANRQSIASSEVDDQGRYNFSVPSPGEYSLRYRQRDSTLVWGSRSVTSVLGAVTVVNLPVSPQGVVYDSSGRVPVAGVQVGLTDVDGVLLPQQCLLQGQQNQTTDASGRYVFALQYGADTSCPSGADTYQINVSDVPPGYVAGLSTRIPPQQDVFEASGCDAPCLIQTQNDPPQTGSDTQYYASFRASAEDPVLINNHLPIDRAAGAAPPPTSAGLEINVSTSRRSVPAGGVVGYVILITNTSDLLANGTQVIDQSAPAISPIDGTAVLVRPGADGVLGTDDDDRQDWEASGGRQTTFDPFDIPAQSQVQIEFVGRVSANARPGPQENRSTASAVFVTGPEEVSDTALVNVISDALMDKATVIGKVFLDHNRNGVQDEDASPPEFGLAGARLLTPEGLLIETDRHGRYHIADVDVNRSMGVNYVVKIDTHSLPERAQVLNDLRQVVRLMPGDIGKINYAVFIPGADKDCCPKPPPRASWDSFRPEKKLDVWVASIGKPQNGEVPVEFHISSNYAQFLGSGLLSFSAGSAAVEQSPHDQCFVFQRKRSTAPVVQKVFLPVQPGAYDFVLQVFQEDLCGELPPAISGLTYDQTLAQRVDLSVAKPLQFGNPPAGRDLTVISGIVLPPGVRGLRHENGVLLVEDLIVDSDSYVELHDGTWRIVDTSREIEDATKFPRLLSGDNTLEVNFNWRGVDDAAGPQTLTLHHGLDPEADKVTYQAEGATTFMTCCEVPTSAGIFVDDSNSVSTLRLSNLSKKGIPLEVCVQIKRAKGLIGIAGDCLFRSTLEPETSAELFLGTFRDGPLSTAYWDELRVTLRDPSGREFFYDVTRARAAEDGVLRPPRITATCFDVKATPQVTEDRGVASITLQSDAPPIPLPEQNYGVGVLDLTLGHNKRSGDLDNSFIDQQWDRGSYSDGRIAAYWRGVQPIAERSLSWVVQLDSSKDELKNLTDNLQREDPDRVFRQLDGDLYYPTYGDDSTTLLDTNSQGAFYARVNYAQSHALWGNYNTQLTGSEFSHYNRSLYGFQSHIRSETQSSTGESRHALKLFGSQAQSSLAHAEFSATGGSLYYLRHTDIVMGSEKVWVEVRRQNSQQVEEREMLVAGRDYEVDPLQGRILLRRPLSQIMQNRWQSVVQSLPLDGDRVFLLVDYEYVPTDFAGDDLLYGGRIETHPLESLAIGMTHVTEQQDRGDHQLNGVDLQLGWGDNSYVSAEYAHTDDVSQSAGLRSFDGGLTFDSRSPSFSVADIGGEALGFESYIDLADVNLTEGLFRAWWKRRAEGFNSGRFALGPQITDRGFDIEARIHPEWTISASAGDLEQQGVSQSQTARAQLSGKTCRPSEAGDLCRYIDVEGRYERASAVTIEDFRYDPLVGKANLLGVRFGQDLDAGNTLYATLQKVITSSDDYPDNDRVAVGWNNKVSNGLSLGLEGSTGDRGHALTGGVNFALDKRASVNLSSGIGSAALSQFSSNYQLSEGHEVYGSYRVSPDRNDAERNMMTFGQRRDMGSRTSIFTESQFGKDSRQASTGHVLGLEYDASQEWVISSTLQKSLVERSLGDYRRTAVSAGATYQNETTRFSARFEVRKDEGSATDLSQYLVSSALTQVIDENSRVLAKLNVSWLDDRESSQELGRFVELNLGYAIRPALSDRLNLISRYAYLFDVGSQGQTDSPGDERSHILASEGLYELTRRLRLGGKLAYRKGESRLGKGEGHWFDLETALAVARFEYQIVIPEDKQWQFYFPDELELIAEYRWMKDFAGDGRQQGALFGIYKQVDGRRINLGPILAPSLRVGVGYNFSGFDDDMRSSTFKSHGWFVDMMALF